MKEAFAEYQSLLTAWDGLRKAWPSETDFRPYGLKHGRAEDFDALFGSWGEAIAKAANSTRTAGEDDQALESILIHLIGKVVQQLNAASSNGYGWLFTNSPFLTALAELNAAVVPLVDRRFSLRKKVVEAAKNELFDSMARVESAAPVADALVKKQGLIEEQAESVKAALTFAEEAATNASSSAELANRRLAEVQTILDAANSKKVDYDQVVSDANDALSSAKEVLGNVQTAQNTANTELKKSNELIGAANQKLSKAIQDINRQGMAGAYENGAAKLGRERIMWMIAFLAAIIYLVLVACGIFGGHGPASEVGDAVKKVAADPMTMSFWEKILRLLPLAAPGVWLGWFAAKNASLVSRVQQDYSFKMATALAFEAHKKEVLDASGDELRRKLLETTISNFGDNPIRIYDGKAADGHPLESLRNVLTNKDNFEKLVRLLEAAKPIK